jgi:nucleotide-binding universal stress UspA family protein
MYHNILVPTDGSELGNKAIKEAAVFAKTSGAKLVLFHAVHSFHRPLYAEGLSPSIAPRDTEAEKKQMEAEANKVLDIASRAAMGGGVVVEREFVVSDRPYEAIIDAAKKHKCDLIAMSSHGHGGITGLLLGSETQKVLANSRVPVLVVR